MLQFLFDTDHLTLFQHRDKKVLPRFGPHAGTVGISAVGTGTAVWLLATRRSRREREWPHPPLVISPKRDERFTRERFNGCVARADAPSH